jgi:hypothetical protein
MEKAKGAACSWGRPAVALAMAALIRSLIEPLSGLREVLRVTRSAGRASGSSMTIESAERLVSL